MSYICPVCGYPELKHEPHTVEEGGSYEICQSCGYQFGITDEDKHITYKQWRKQWIDKGMKWRAVSISPPINWNPRKQLENLKTN